MESGDYTLSGCEGGSNSTYSMETYDGTTYRACQNGKTTFNTTGTSIRFYISVRSGVTMNNVKFYPMLIAGTDEKTYEPYGAMPSPEYPSEIQNVEGDVNVTVANKEKTEQQTVTFPLSQGQKLYLGDYLAEDGIHHVRKQIELDGTENWVINSVYPSIFYLDNIENINTERLNYELLCNTYKYSETISTSANAKNNTIFGFLRNSTTLFSRITIKDERFNTLADFKNYLVAQKQAGTPVVVEYVLAEEEIEAYTEEQQEAYNQLKQLTAYDEETNVYSTNEVSPIFKVTAVKDINSVITQLNTVLLERS